MKQPWLLACLVFDRSSLINGLWSFGFPLTPRSFILTKLLDSKTGVGEAMASPERETPYRGGDANIALRDGGRWRLSLGAARLADRPDPEN